MGYLTFSKDKKIKIKQDYYMLCRGGLIKKINNADNIEMPILNIYDKNNLHDFVFGNTFFVDKIRQKIYLDSQFHGIFEYDINKRIFSKVNEGNLLAFDSDNEKLFYDYKTNLFSYNVNTQKETYIGKTRPRKGALFRKRIAKISRNEILYNDIDKVYKYNLDTGVSQLTDITHCDVHDVYRKNENSILCYYRGKHFMLNLQSKEKYYLDTSAQNPFHYDEKHDLLFYRKLKLDVFSKSLEKYLTIVYDFDKNKEYLYSEDCWF